MSDWTPYALLFLVINLAVSISGTYLLGMAGPLLGTAAGLVLVKSWAMPYLFRKKFKWLPLSLWQKALWPLVWGLPFGGLVWWAARNRTIENWFQLFLEVSLTGLGGLALWVVAGMTAHERQAWRTRLQTAWQG